MSRLTFGVIGYGHIGRRHVIEIQKHPEARLLAVCELPGYERPKELSDDVIFTDSVETLLALEELDIVHVCTPNYLHQHHTVAALNAAKHVVCEKPMALSTRECDAMIQAATLNSKTIFVVKQNRYNEPVQQVKKYLDQGKLGDVYLVDVRCFWNRNAAYYQQSAWRGKRLEDGGCLFTQFSHFVDILYYLMGTVSHMEGRIVNQAHPYIETEDSGAFSMQTRHGALVNFVYSTCSYQHNMEGSITILAEKGTIRIGGQYLNKIDYQCLESGQLPPVHSVVPPNEYGTYQGSMSNHDKVIDNVIQTLKGKQTAMTNAWEGREVVGIIEAMYASVK